MIIPGNNAQSDTVHLLNYKNMSYIINLSLICHWKWFSLTNNDAENTALITEINYSLTHIEKKCQIIIIIFVSVFFSQSSFEQ